MNHGVIKIYLYPVGQGKNDDGLFLKYAWFLLIIRFIFY